jgi:SPP1 family predicted phage head-tail adaptor|nr:MAG TPA: Putative head tail adaptor [Caudoviricetes sp.]
MINAGRYGHRIRIVKDVQTTDKDGFPTSSREVILEPYARVKTTRGFTLIQNDSDFEKALTNFTIRYPGNTTIDRDMLIEYNGKTYTIEYVNNVNEANIEIELQAKAVTH